eukprot:scaffold4013_cov140-Isochrysis_galbana.AAC.10
MRGRHTARDGAVPSIALSRNRHAMPVPRTGRRSPAERGSCCGRVLTLCRAPVKTEPLNNPTGHCDCED